MADLQQPHSALQDEQALALAARLRMGDRAALARAITLIESRKAEHGVTARALVQAVLADTGKAVRLGITGVPGVGKSTLIDRLGTMLTAQGRRVAVLAVDPSSTRSGGSILGDKTRMAGLAADRHAFVRPSPSAGTLGGVAARTREAMLLCEAAGFDVVVVETIGVGQSETAVSDLVDCFLVLMLAGAGDALQGIKKGVIELADIIAVNKADGDGTARAHAAAVELRAALQILGPSSPAWTVPVTTVSGATGDGLDALWALVADHHARMEAAGLLQERRQRQQVTWLKVMLEERLTAPLRSDPAVRRRLREAEAEVAAGRLAPLVAVETIAAMVSRA